MIGFIIKISLNNRIQGLQEIFINKPEIVMHFDEALYEFMAWGDPISDEFFKIKLEKSSSPEFIVNNLSGHYYFLYLNKQNGELKSGNSLFSILPIYYHIGQGIIILSENVLTLGKFIGSDAISKRFVLETILFNYPLFNNSVLTEISLLPSNSYFSFKKGEFSIKKHTKIEDLFEKKPLPWQKTVKALADEFLETIEKYLPSEQYASALTGGFDGRTLVSAGLYYKKDFSAYSFGSETSKDVKIAEMLSFEATLPFIKIELGDGYINHESYGCGEEFIINSSYNATFARAHYLFAAKQLSKQFKYIITGNFGSEIFRAAHVAGVVIAGNLFALFNSDIPEAAFKEIESSPEFCCLNKSAFKAEWESLKSDLEQLPCFNKHYSDLTKNQKFYVFVFEELFRKYFGAEMVNQFKYLKNRTPFLDIDFLKAIFQSELAGIHSDFFEHNPVKRFKGQVLYAYIIEKAYPAFGQLITDKGYKPDDLKSFSGKINIAKGYFKKITRRVPPDFDPYGVGKAWERNQNIWNKIPIPSELFNSYLLNEKESAINNEIIFKIISICSLIDMNKTPLKKQIDPINIIV
jgi:asparagine synthase (glutamine-hydrolysing)